MRATTLPSVPSMSLKNVLSVREHRKLTAQIITPCIKKSISEENSKSRPLLKLKAVGYKMNFETAVYASMIKQICLTLIFISVIPLIYFSTSLCLLL